MKRIKLKISNTLSCDIDLKNINAQNIQDVGGMRAIHLARIDIGAGNNELEIVRANGAQIVYALLTIEDRIESILAEYLFGPTLGTPKPKKDFFVNEILQSNKFDYSFKKELLGKIINYQSLLTGVENDSLQNDLREIMTWRNAFAHGKLRADNSQVCHLDFYSGGKKSIILDDKFWGEVEGSFSQIDELLKKLKLNSGKITTA